ncbi:hypothetical protein, partial [Akkermansia sp.]|uniref:hypothetical protein n=1 Tax=Akkermansia sp. TaxID=1872421 RepID=UPI003A8DEC8F
REEVQHRLLPLAVSRGGVIKEREFFFFPASAASHPREAALFVLKGRKGKKDRGYKVYRGDRGNGGVAIIDAYFLSEPPFENSEKHKSASTRPAC